MGLQNSKFVKLKNNFNSLSENTSISSSHVEVCTLHTKYAYTRQGYKIVVEFNVISSPFNHRHSTKQLNNQDSEKHIVVGSCVRLLCILFSKSFTNILPQPLFTATFSLDFFKINGENRKFYKILNSVKLKTSRSKGDYQRVSLISCFGYFYRDHLLLSLYLIGEITKAAVLN